jgi:hypothetical protein
MQAGAPAVGSAALGEKIPKVRRAGVDNLLSFGIFVRVDSQAKDIPIWMLP